MKLSLLFAFGLMACVTGAGAQTGVHIAGLQPDRRPDTAPQLAQATRTPYQVERALHGIEAPVPGNVQSIAATGNWWVPLRAPGMSAPYDLRGWHDAQTSVSTATPAKPASAQSVAGSSTH
ncbi:MAG: hypothetical protein LBV61_02920 [Burkholderiaceae bacterium]|jgi:hypothetical protein|nr:hypothetical protein [Burkholderiaceae bacterium]